MKTMILAAGRGERMRPLTDHTPKPLLEAGGKPLIVWHLERLAAAGLREIVINHAWLGDRLEAALGDGRRWGVRITWSPEPAGGLETAGGIAQALPWLDSDPFLVINGDVWCDWDPGQARDLARAMPTHDLAWLLLVDNPSHHPEGDFWLADHTAFDAPPASTQGAPRLTFSGIGLYRPELLAGMKRGSAARLAPLLRQAMGEGRVRANQHGGIWVDVGTPERLAALDRDLRIGVGETMNDKTCAR